MQSDITYLGNIIRVDSNTIEVEISDSIPSSSPIIGGKVYKIGQIGTFVKIPVGNIVSYGIVESVSNMPNKELNTDIQRNLGSRYLTINLIGEKLATKNSKKELVYIQQ